MTSIGRSIALALLLAAISMLTKPVIADDRSIIVQSTTSTANSGLYAHLLPAFEAETGIAVHVVAVGTGQALRNARNCDGDVLLVHDKASEDAFVEEGFGVERFDLMYNDFVIVGPPADPAGIGGMQKVTEALVEIAMNKALFASRGDDSGTHKKERALWATSGIDPSEASGEWYRETGSGMGATLNIAVGMGAYVMTDRATWISFRNKDDFTVLIEGQDALFNQYGVVLIDEKACPHVKTEFGQHFVDWIRSTAGQDAISTYRVEGQQLFFPNADPTS
jgi:tungstate transport system substrate-binding protein